jgi:putative NIF3 family GTP cyclohydrolase 1 type 2
VGWLAERVRRLMAHGINLFAYHLPLDAHPELGNNAQLGLRLGSPPTPDSVTRTWASPARHPCRSSTRWPPARRRCWAASRWCVPATAGPCGAWPGAPEARRATSSSHRAGADAFVTGEISEPQAHLARETGVAFLACGHHATERFGAPAVAAATAGHFGLEHRFVEIANPA